MIIKLAWNLTKEKSRGRMNANFIIKGWSNPCQDIIYFIINKYQTFNVKK